MKIRVARHFENNAIFGWIAIVVAAVLLIPLIAMQFPTGFNWTMTDFLAAAVLLFGTASFYVLAARKIQKTSHRVAVGVIFALALVYVWAELAVGIFTTWGS